MRPGRRAASPLFWTLGGQQVGRAAISGWREILVPALRSRVLHIAIWPFAGPLAEMIAPGQIVVVETYPAEFYTHLGITFSPSREGKRSGKRVQSDRASNATTLSSWTETNGIELSPELRKELEDGFGPSADGEDRFDAVIGLFGMLNVLLGRRSSGEPEDDTIARIEGWILGQNTVPEQPETPT